MRLEDAGEVGTGELAALVRIEDLRLTVALQRLLQCFDAKLGMHRVRQPPGQHPARVPVHNRHQIQEPALDRDVGDVVAPSLVRAINYQVFEKVRIDPMLRMRLAGRYRSVKPLWRIVWVVSYAALAT